MPMPQESSTEKSARLAGNIASIERKIETNPANSALLINLRVVKLELAHHLAATQPDEVIEKVYHGISDRQGLDTGQQI